MSSRADSSNRARAKRLRSALEELGPTFAKLGQILSTRPDLLPEEFIQELAMLQDKVPPMTELEVVTVMEEELGVPWEDVFESIDPVPLAAGTIGQVHKATLETGDRVVVKVQRPNARTEIMRDLGLLELFGQKTETRPAFRQVVDMPAVIAHLSASLRRELDFRQEASNIAKMRIVLEPYTRLDVPAVYEALSTSRLLVLEEIQGVPVREAPEGTDRRDAAKQLLESYYRQILADGFFHADPHPGNMLWWNGKIYFLDLGMVGEVGPEIRELMVLMMMAFWQQDVTFLSEVVLMLAGQNQPDDLDVREFQEEIAKLMAQVQGASLHEIQLGPIMQGLTEIATRHDVRLPASLALTGKALAQMQLAAAELDPTLDPFAAIGSFLFRSFADSFREKLSAQRAYYESQKLRVRVTRVVEAFERMTGARPGAKLQVDFRGTGPLEDTIRMAARRLALAVTAAGALVATGTTAASTHVADWVPITLGAVGGALTIGLILELFSKRRRRS
jgi:predicted unusual protein kinase regulating ubiquinone biosynthesis (AarF/ABC1/UbiB family)